MSSTTERSNNNVDIAVQAYYTLRSDIRIATLYLKFAHFWEVKLWSCSEY